MTTVMAGTACPCDTASQQHLTASNSPWKICPESFGPRLGSRLPSARCSLHVAPTSAKHNKEAVLMHASALISSCSLRFGSAATATPLTSSMRIFDSVRLLCVAVPVGHNSTEVVPVFCGCHATFAQLTTGACRTSTTTAQGAREGSEYLQRAQTQSTRVSRAYWQASSVSLTQRTTSGPHQRLRLGQAQQAQRARRPLLPTLHIVEDVS